jgi:predicted dehydrogenase
VRIGVLGCGSIGRRHLKNLHDLGQSDIVVFDPSAEVLERIKRQWHVPSFAELEPIWACRPDVVLITAPTNWHTELALEASRRGCHLFIEKPISHSLAASSDLCNEVDTRALVTMVGCNLRFHPGPATVKRLIEEGAIGQILSLRVQTGSYLPGWRPEQNYKNSYSASNEWGGAILDCIHELDLALWYVGPARLLYAARLPATSIGLQTEGLAEILLEHEAQILSSIHLNFVQRDYRRTCQVIGSEGTIYWDFEKGCVDVYSQDGKLGTSFGEPDNWQVNQMYVDELSHFLSSVESNKPAMNPVNEAFETLRIALAALDFGRA